MANDKVKEENEEKTEEKPAKKSGMALPVIIIIIFVAVAALGAGGWFLYSSIQPAAAEELEGVEAEDETTAAETNIFFDGFQTGIVNLAVSEEYPFMYLKYKFDVEVTSTEVMSEMADKLPRLESKIATVISNRDWMEISSAHGRERLSRDCMREINDDLTSGEVIGLYFNTFVAQ
ncbi:MAG TPA: flagellar basal body-associated FliL family protein [bacterium]|jgi:flagellar basal body-associated protein FliL